MENAGALTVPALAGRTRYRGSARPLQKERDADRSCWSGSDTVAPK